MISIFIWALPTAARYFDMIWPAAARLPFSGRRTLRGHMRISRLASRTRAPTGSRIPAADAARMLRPDDIGIIGITQVRRHFELFPGTAHIAD